MSGRRTRRVSLRRRILPGRTRRLTASERQHERGLSSSGETKAGYSPLPVRRPRITSGDRIHPHTPLNPISFLQAHRERRRRASKSHDVRRRGYATHEARSRSTLASAIRRRCSTAPERPSNGGELMTLPRLRLPAITFFVVLSSLAAASADSSAAPEPTLVSPPVISGTAKEGQTLTLEHGHVGREPDAQLQLPVVSLRLDAAGSCVARPDGAVVSADLDRRRQDPACDGDGVNVRVGAGAPRLRPRS